MIYYKKLNFTHRGYNYNLDINDNITQIRGDSAIGKTYTVNALKDANKNKISLKVDPKHQIFIIDGSSYETLKLLSSITSSLIVIDNFDELVALYRINQSSDIALPEINTDTNQYVIIARGTYQIPTLGIQDMCSIQIQDNNISLRYYNKYLRRAYCQ